MITFDTWSVIARINMYGCDVVGYSTGLEIHDSLCTQPEAMGWNAAWFFVTFTLFANVVLLNLFIGVLVTSMDLIQVSVMEEYDVRTRAIAIQKKFNIQEYVGKRLEDIFILLDENQNGRLSVSLHTYTTLPLYYTILTKKTYNACVVISPSIRMFFFQICTPFMYLLLICYTKMF